ncbi:MAG: MspA family porin [Gordonia paraffinivorans]
MSTKSKLGLRRLAAGAAIAAVSAVGLASMGAGNAAAGPLPNGSKTTTGIDGEVVTLKRLGESAYPVPSVANNSFGRAAEVSGTIVATAPKGADATLISGYIVGCQINVGGLSLGLNGSLDLSPEGILGGSFSLPLAPGQATFVPISSAKSIKGGQAIIQYKRQQIDVQKCGGYATARAYSQVELKGDSYIKSTLYGAPFSLN